MVASLAAKVPAAGNARHYAQIVKQNALMRRLDGAAKRIQQSVAERDGDPENLVEEAERLLFQVAHEERAVRLPRDRRDPPRRDRQARGAGQGRRRRHRHRHPAFATSTSVTGGFQPGNLIVIAARPAMGKSTLVCNIAENVAVKDQKAVALFSLEMSEMELAHRFIASQARISGDRLRKGASRARTGRSVVKACNQLESAPLWIDDSSDLGLLDLRAKARRLHAQEKSQGTTGSGW